MVNPSVRSESIATLRARAASRAAQRGASVLIVLLVITLLMGIGMYAARSAALATEAAGSAKRLVATQYVSEYAIMNATAALSRDPSRYVNQMPKYVAVAADPKCYGFATVPNATCFPVSFQQLQGEAGIPLVADPDVPNKVPGGLGLAPVQADFNIDITDLAPASPPIAGDALNSDSPVKVGYLSLTLTATAQLLPKPKAGDNYQQLLQTSGSVQAWRAHVVVGPLSNPAARPPAF